MIIAAFKQQGLLHALSHVILQVGLLLFLFHG